MEKTYTIHTDANALTIELNPKKPAIVIVGLGVLAVFYAFLAFIIIRIIEGQWTGPSPKVGVAGLLVFTILYLLVARAFIKRLTHQEIIVVDATTICIIDKYLLSKKVKKYELKYVRQIGHAGAENFTRHPLDGNSGDIGFRGMEGMVQYSISDGNIVLSTTKHSQRFGRNVPSWDTEEIVSFIEDYTGRSFSPKPEPETTIEARRYRGQM